MVIITPGIIFLARCGVFPVVAGCFFVALRRYIILPLWALMFLTILSGPATLTLRQFYFDLRDQRDAAAMGARIVPRAKGKWIGDFDLVRTLRHSWKFGYPGDGLRELQETTGPTMKFNLLSTNLIFTTSPEHIKIILATDFPNFIKGDRFRRVVGSVMGMGIFSSDGNMWKFHRSAMRPTFTRDRISNFEIFDCYAEQVITQMRNRMRAGYPVDLQDLMLRYTLDAASEFFFGVCLQSLSGTIPYPHNTTPVVPVQHTSLQAQRTDAFSKAVFTAQHAIALREYSDCLWPLFEILEDKTMEPMKIVNAYIASIVEEGIRKKKSMPEGDNNVDSEYAEGETLLEHLVRITSDSKLLHDAILTTMIAGRDTTASALTFTIYLLSLHPEVVTRLRNEILQKVGPDRAPDSNDIRDMTSGKTYMVKITPLI